MKFILGKIEVNLTEDNNDNISKEKRILLKKCGIKSYDISHYKANKFDFINKEKLKLIQIILSGRIVTGALFEPLNKKNKISKAENYLIVEGLK